MATLAKCLDQTTDISKAEKKALLKSAQQYLDEGHGEKSSIKAVQDVLKEIDTERSDILAQVRKLNQATTILDKIAESPKFEIGDYVMPKPDSGISDKRYPARVQHISRGGNGEQTLKVEHSGNLHFAAYNFDKVEKPEVKKDSAEKPAKKEDVSIDDLSAMIDEIGAEEGLIEKPVSPGGKAEGVKTGLAAVADILKDIDGSANFQVARQDVPPVTHPEAYAQAKEHLSESYAEFIQKGNEIKEWVRHALVELKKLGAPFELSKNWVLNFYANDRPELDKAPDSDNIIDKDKEAQDAETTTDRSPEGEQGGVLPANEEGGGFGALFGPGSGGVRGPESVNDSRRDEGTRSDGVHTEGPVGKSVLDYRISSSDRLGAGGAKTKYANNVAAIKALQRLGDKQATIEDQRILAKYVGWGGIPQAFYRPDGSVAKGWGVQASELQNLLSKEEYEAARASTQDAHYTSEAIIKSIYKGLARIGFRSGKILEPSVGTGNFLGIIPKKIKKRSKFVAVEKDNITAAIAKHLYPEQKVHQTGFEKFDITPGSFDLAIGNPPFGSKKLFDPNNKNLRKFSIHNFFFAKSLIGLRPNGLLSMVVSSAMMDKNNSTQRRWLAERAELLGAVRLPNNAFKGNAGTEVTTDIIFLRKREEGEYRGGPSWENLKPVIGPDGVTYHVNEYFADNPDKMLGELAHNKLNPRAKEDIIENGVYRAVPGMVATGDMAEGLKAAIESLPEGVYVKGKRLEEVQNPDIIVSDPGFTKVYGYTIDDNGNAARRLPDKNGEQRYEPILYAEKPLEGKRLDRLKGMLKIRDTVRQLIREEISDGLNIETLRRKLNSQYDLFQKNYGYISAPGNQQVMKDDPTDYPLLRSLEDDYDKGLSPGVAKKTGETPRKKSAKKAAIFRERLRHPYHAPIKAADAKEALAISLREDGVVDMDRIVSLSGKTEQDAIEELAGFVFLNPANETWETRDFYLSGNVKEKLREAKRVGYQSNIEALKEVQPKDVDPGNIFFKIGATWIPGEIYEGFADEVLHATATVIHHEQVGRWTANIGNSRQQTGLGTDRMDAGKIFEKIVQSRDIAIYDTMEDRTRVFNREATLEANQKADEMQRAFNEWALKDHARSEILAKEFNDKVNTNVKTVPDGSHMIFPGMGVITAGVKRDDQLRPHQKDVVWRLIQKGLGLLDHVVGSGKTFAAIAAGMEMKRMGLAQKPMYVVPNHLVSQWADDFQKLYPGANVLVITRKDFTAKKRQEFMGRITTGSWDAVLMAHSSFGFVRAPVTYQQKFYRDMIAQYEEAIEQMREAEGKKTRSVKQAEKARDRLQEKLDALGDMTGDDVVDFGDLGVDALFVDEAHEYKNLFYATSRTRIAGLGNPAGSKKAFDMFVKTRFLQENNSGKGVFFLTGTPVSNTIAEMYTMMRYMSYDRLESMGIKHFDQWANMFADLSSDWEVDPSGTRYRLQSRFRGFVNTPGMMGIYKDFADVISQQNLIDNAEKIGEKWPVPEIKGGKPENVVVERSDLQGSFMRWIVQRMDNMPSDPSEDNPLKATGEAMKAALDIRLINENLPDHPGSKVNKAIGNIFDIYKKWTPRKGAQLVFCDLSVPKKARTKQHKDIVDLRADLARIEAELEIETRPRQLEKLEAEYEKVSSKFERFSYSDIIAAESSFSVYDDIKKKLIKKGVPENEIAFIHDANTDIQKGDLFAKVRAGRIRVLIGSTFKMGAGMNVQKRLVALHHLDAPWRPSDLEQREGRIIRQGNDFFDESMDAGGDLFEVEIYRYATKETL
ncbi:MAG: N-6 DNA methylase, partial [Deltaproteobacteria bacterium]|nr:N-6 DNA methylase [Deltaproteobacteria bacterium]